jgi:hypothetical protein
MIDVANLLHGLPSITLLYAVGTEWLPEKFGNEHLGNSSGDNHLHCTELSWSDSNLKVWKQHI